MKQIKTGYSFENAVSILREEFTSFIFDGHFTVDGIPVFDIKRFYYDTEEEKLQLEAFAKSGAEYKNCQYLIFDLRMNKGGAWH